MDELTAAPHRSPPILTTFYRVLLGFTGCYWVLLGFTGFYWVLLGLIVFYIGDGLQKPIRSR